MATDWHNPYAQTAAYFVFQSILTITSSFVSICILTIHWIEHNNHKFNDLPINSLSPTRSTTLSNPTTLNTKNKKKLKIYTFSQRIILRLTWATIIIFCTICILLSLLTIVEQVARLNEFEIILCNKWTARVLCSTFQFGVGLMRCLFMAQLYEIYNNTEFAYSPAAIRIFSLIIINAAVASSILIFLFCDVDQYDIEWLKQKHSTCNTVVPQFVNITLGGTEGLVTLLMLYLFIKPMNKMIRIHKSTLNETQYPSRVIFEVHKITTLALTATISTILMLAMVGWTYAIWPVFINMPLNCICLMFMTSYYPNGYKKICCLSTRLQIRLFTKLTKEQLRSQKIYHASNQSSVIALNDIPKIDLQKKQIETEEYLDTDDHLRLANNESYDPYGGKAIKRTTSSSPNSNSMLMNETKVNKNKDGHYALLSEKSSNSEVKNELKTSKKNSKHKNANTTEMMIMDINPMNVSKTKSESIEMENTNMEMNDTMLSRSASDKYDNDNNNNNNNTKKQQLLDSNMKQQTKKGSSFVLSDNDMNDLMDTIDNHQEYNANEQIDYQTSNDSTKL